jgi:stage II sporulation protein D
MRRALVALCLALLVGALVPVPARPAPDKRLGAAVAPVTLVPRRGSTISVGGLHRYFGSVEIGSAADGLVLVNEVPFERYLLGLNEVPVTWPAEALKAQAVAARTFALYTLLEPKRPDAAAYGFDICATDQCQVFSGADVVGLPDGERWTAAVDATAGQVVQYDGRPIFARYHSTSGGRTLSNSEAFPGEPDYPYLRPVASTTERASPLYRWRVDFPLRDLQVMLERAGWWGSSFGRLKTVRTQARPEAEAINPAIAFEGTRGRMVRTAEELRDVVRTLAPSMFPGRYPSSADTMSGVLPETFPSHRITITTARGIVRVLGRGWGHGAGMSQWGAFGLAQQGASYSDILAHYYTGTTVGSATGPRVVRVGVGWSLSSASASGDFKIVDGAGRTLVRRALGTWGFRWTGSGAVAVDPPRGYGLPLRVGIVESPRTVEVGDSTFITVALSRPAKVQPVTSAPAPRERYPARIEEAGRRRIPWLAPLEPGRYRVVVRASTGATVKKSRPVDILVRAPEQPVIVGPPLEPPDPDEPAGTWLPVAATTVSSFGEPVAMAARVFDALPTSTRAASRATS